MIQSFLDQATEDIFNGTSTRLARKRLPQTLWRVAHRKLDQLDAAEDLNDLRIPLALHRRIWGVWTFIWNGPRNSWNRRPAAYRK